MDKQQKMQLRRDAGYRDLPEKATKNVGPEYAMSFACFTCRTANKRHFESAPCDYPDTMMCPICKEATFNLGRHFKAPKKSDLSQWKKVEFLVEHGFVFQKIRLNGNTFESVPYPKTLSEAKEFVIKYEQYAIK